MRGAGGREAIKTIFLRILFFSMFYAMYNSRLRGTEYIPFQQSMTFNSLLVDARVLLPSYNADRDFDLPTIVEMAHIHSRINFFLAKMRRQGLSSSSCFPHSATYFVNIYYKNIRVL